MLVGTWDLRGNGQLAAAYHDGANLQVVEGGSTRNYSFGNVVWSVFGATDTDGQPGAEIIGRTSTGIYVISNASSRKEHSIGASAWALHGGTTDTDGKPGNELIVVMQGKVRVIHHASGDVNYSIDSVADMDNQPGAEILVRDANGKLFVFNDRTGKVSS
ncbi:MULTISPECIES: hypothetical protein [Pseudomonas aeruginosa group]|uniref:Uncharacterized protein n=1 Tax=Pseudomonas paraeruginosa (strain DSM 24068 / PA7) TaxID=381754 RepID=A6VDF4_PSEP7|nr:MULTISPECIES: hypothetical protein [Pseudomonas aeruginosa group]ABR85424.1 hypothetical protein PSPA7_5770 [Pseudomonas aeruginosa PA7]MBH8711871.1 hypothetical protein [Pseudomonas aeruginosa]MBH9341160.1 hypothetical protein [Pseudomonas aeruginosa]MBH9394631.1 hypothetical protein [Pseudomonas aeruginosa]MBI8113438.1 hypothetical protein [Pseudomonas aeruginosa]